MQLILQYAGIKNLHTETWLQNNWTEITVWCRHATVDEFLFRTNGPHTSGSIYVLRMCDRHERVLQQWSQSFPIRFLFHGDAAAPIRHVLSGAFPFPYWKHSRWPALRAIQTHRLHSDSVHYHKFYDNHSDNTSVWRRIDNRDRCSHRNTVTGPVMYLRLMNNHPAFAPRPYARCKNLNCTEMDWLGEEKHVCWCWPSRLSF